MTAQPGELYCPSCDMSYDAGDRCPRDGMRLIRIHAVDPLVGRVLDERYTILEKIGFGGMGAVYRAKQHSMDREVAVKVVHANLMGKPEMIKRFLREAHLASRLGHPNAVAILDFGRTDDGIFYLVMELLAGRTLETVVQEEGVFEARRLVRIGMQVCEALEAAHSLAIVHRDLKPSNIILLATGRDLVKVVDFGLAKSLEASASQATATGAVCGTPAYMAPERACGAPSDARSDLYSLGCILYLLGTGRLPSGAPTSGVPVALADVIDRLLAVDPAERYQTAAEVRDALEESVPITREMRPVRLSTEMSALARALTAPDGLAQQQGTGTVLSLAASPVLPRRVAIPPPAPVVAPPPQRRGRIGWAALLLAAALAALATSVTVDEPPAVERADFRLPIP